jgi:3-phenylpropionate/trans-cinnamate dioxygenase ferredoxin subunit
MRTLVASTEEIEDGEAKVVVLGDEEVALLNDGGSFYGLAARCPHGNASLADGFIEDGTVECPLHASLFDLKTGMVLCKPATDSVKAYAVVVEGEKIYIEQD